MNGYADNWMVLSRRWRQFFIVWLGGLIVTFALAYVSYQLFQTFVLGWIAAAAWMLGFLVSGIRIKSFPCPRCGQPFFVRRGTFAGIPWSSYNVLRRSCGTCGLMKGAAAEHRVAAAGRSGPWQWVYAVSAPAAERWRYADWSGRCPLRPAGRTIDGEGG